jgi:hypothetical protein
MSLLHTGDEWDGKSHYECALELVLAYLIFTALDPVDDIELILHFLAQARENDEIEAEEDDDFSKRWKRADGTMRQSRYEIALEGILNAVVRGLDPCEDPLDASIVYCALVKANDDLDDDLSEAEEDDNEQV